MTRTQLIATLAARQPHLTHADVNDATKQLLGLVSQSLAAGERVEIRGFGCFVLRYRRPRMGRNPKLGTPVALAARYVPHFKASKRLREQVSGIQRSSRVVAA